MQTCLITEVKKLLHSGAVGGNQTGCFVRTCTARKGTAEDEKIEDEFDLLKLQMNSLGFTKLSEMFAYLEDDGEKPQNKKSDMEM